ncbi:MAG TPA: ATP-binding protein [Acidimicrobiales bacterium]|nr:ATP-binding protein [Acidimicrobiales bacterium]
MSAAHRREFLPTPTSAAAARRFVESVLAGTELDHLSYPATMLVSELVTNAILHSGTPLAVSVIPDGSRIRVEVHDGSAEMAVRRHYSEMSGTGRGLMLVEQMAAEWGSERTADGKVVWFEIDGAAAAMFDLLGVDAL